MFRKGLKVLSVLNPSLDDYKISGAASFGIKLGLEMINSENISKLGFIANIDSFYEYVNSIYDESNKYPVVDNTNIKVHNISFSKRSVVRDTIKEAVNIFNKNDYDIIHIHIHQMSVLSSIYKYIPDYIPVVYTQHTSTIMGRFSRGYIDDAYNLSIHSKNVKIVCPSYSMKNIWMDYIFQVDKSRDNYDELMELYTDRVENVEVIRNGILDNDNIELVDPRDKKGKCISVGRIDPNKGMLEVARFCVDNNHPVVLIGDSGMGSLKMNDSQREYYDNFVNICNENSNIITWYKYLDNSEVRKKMSESDVYISFSNKESFSLVTAESLSVGTPILYLEENAVKEIAGTHESMMIKKSSISRKRWKTKSSIYEEYFQLQQNNIHSIRDVESNYPRMVRDRFLRLGLGIDRCSENYLQLYTEVIGNVNYSYNIK